MSQPLADHARRVLTIATTLEHCDLGDLEKALYELTYERTLRVAGLLQSNLAERLMELQHQAALEENNHHLPRATPRRPRPA